MATDERILFYTGVPLSKSDKEILNIIRARSSDTVLRFEREPGATTGKVYYVPAANTVRSSATVDKIRLADYGGSVDFSKLEES
ncbi:hypothetical protein I5P86_08300 [Pseudomonas glycinae]|uniref:hypothetical protein n=1 Tax=Pseudomonas TaxID=286 RepID=UPI0018D759E4|nr:MULTISPECIES: hypothetical protein [Pseudomonas]MBH3405047.1 hypothetical protein [Pseudomonas glycinae]MDI3397137.1 hypothetical protein [Pseudomonas sp. V88_4]